MKYLFLFVLSAGSFFLKAQSPDSTYYPNVRTPQLYGYGNQLVYPIIRLGSNDRLELHFDDLDANVKNYFYTYQLCDADWTPAIVSQFDYIRGFSQTRINAYKFSSIALTRYTHYQAIVPDVNCIPTKSGNYMLKVFLDGDTSKLVFTRRFLVVEEGISIAAQVLQPFDPQIFQTHHKIQFTVNTGNLNLVNAFQQVKVVILQNYRWDIALYNVRPSFYSGNTFQFNDDHDCSFPAGKQWRYLDIQSFRFQSDRISHVDYLKTSTTIFARPDFDRSRQAFYYYNDINGLFYVQTTENINPYWQTDYATVNFSFVPESKTPFDDKDVYIIGEMTDYHLNDYTKMNFNPDKGAYEVSLFLKHGYYNYAYVTANRGDPAKVPSFDFTEGNNLETTASYIILVYYRPMGGRTDRLMGMTRLSSVVSRPGS